MSEPPRIVDKVERGTPPTITHWCAWFAMSMAGGGLTLTPVATLLENGVYAYTCYPLGSGPPQTPTFAQVVLWRPGLPIPIAPVTTIPGLVQLARSGMSLAAPLIQTQPPSDRLVVGFETWLGNTVVPTAQTRSAQAGGFWATAQARPVALSIDYGDGTPRQRCPLPLAIAAGGRPDCARHTYLDHRLAPAHDGRFTVTANFTYEIWVTTQDQAVPYLADTIDSAPTTLAVAVHEIQAVLR